MVAPESQKANSEGSSKSLVEVWDVEKTLLMEVYGTRDVTNANEELPQPPEVVGELTDENPAAAIAALVRSRQPARNSMDRFSKRPTVTDTPPSPSPDVRAIVVGHDFGGSSTLNRSGVIELSSDSNSSGRASDGKGFMISGSEDRKLRLWDLSRVDRTVILSGLENENERPSYG